jgi:putative endonuclease
MAWMYILECADGSYYVGSTNDLERRIWEHNEGIGAKYTARRRPVKLVYAAEFASIAEAYEREKQVQGWGRAKREALIRGDYTALPELARKDFEKYRAVRNESSTTEPARANLQDSMDEPNPAR